MRRPRPTRHNSWSTVGIMGSIQPPSPTKIRPGSRDTGFPEPFCGGRNTTLPHPDADLSPNASISADDVPVQHVLHRSRRSFLAKPKHKRTISYGKIVPEKHQPEMMKFSDSAIVLELSEGEVSPSHDGSGRLSKETDVRNSSSIDDDSARIPLHQTKSRNLLRKWRLRP
jgi:hypothetical protein